MRALIGLVGLISLLSVSIVQAQDIAPAPLKMPRTPVKSQDLSAKQPKIPTSRILKGTAKIISPQTINVQGVDVRLFGVVPPQLGASYGPQARAVLDSLAAGTVTCRVLDRQRDGHYLARCRNDQKQDFGLELLRRGLAVTARGTLKQTDIEYQYIATEQTAQTQRLGLWGTSVPNAASSKSIKDQATKMVQEKLEAAKAAKAAKEEARAEKEAVEAKAKKEAEALEAEKAAKEAAASMPAVSLATGDEVVDVAEVSLGKVSENIKPMSANEVLAALSEPTLGVEKSSSTMGMLERFQLLITGLLLLASALIVVGARSYMRWLARKEDLRSIAAALRGELMAARSICKARLSKIDDESSENDVTWPRLRTLVFQAYVGRIGALGADLSRKIASIYGQASDYASYYRAHDGKSNAASKRKALEALVHHIDEVNPRLAAIELSGALKAKPAKGNVQPLRITEERTRKLSLPKAEGSVKTREVETIKEVMQEEADQEMSAAKSEKSSIPLEMVEALKKVKAELALEPQAAQIVDSEEKKPEEEVASSEIAQEKEPQNKEEQKEEAEKAEQETLAKKPLPKASVKRHSDKQKVRKLKRKASAAAVAGTHKKADTKINFAAPIFQKLSEMKGKAADKLARRSSYDAFDVPDYANLTEEEIDELLYADEALFNDDFGKKVG